MKPFLNLHRTFVYQDYQVEVYKIFDYLLDTDRFKKSITVTTHDDVKTQTLGFFDSKSPLPNREVRIDYTPPHASTLDCWYRDDNMVINMFIRFERTSVGSTAEFMNYVQSQFEKCCKHIIENDEGKFNISPTENPTVL